MGQLIYLILEGLIIHNNFYQLTSMIAWMDQVTFLSHVNSKW